MEVETQKSELIEMQEKVIRALKTCYDPEIPVDIWELGLIYELNFDLEKNLQVNMTLTSPMCPVAESLPPEVQQKLQAVPGLGKVRVDIVWNPPWDKDMMSDVAKVELGFY
ncbi:MAG: FeS assembly SUF system protein [Ignavibacteria bacterium GWA2_35_9]|nr:MAG: FeS assembly SUF system protein [Ignavibacteria bacterium GWA2_35_9]